MNPKTLILAALTIALSLSSIASAQSCNGKLIKHAMGTSCIPKNPKRIVVLEWEYAEDMLALDEQPVGMGDMALYSQYVNIPIKLSPNVQDLGLRRQPNLEKMKLLKPDLILVPKFRAQANYSQLSSIAPTVVFDNFSSDNEFDNMRKTFVTIADILGRPTAAQQVIKNLDSHLARLNSKLQKAEMSGKSYVFVGTSSANAGLPVYSVYGKSSMVSQIIDRIGLHNSWERAPIGNGFTNVSFEELAALKTDNFFYVSQKANNPFENKDIQPLWNNLDFVKKGHAYALDERTWVFGGPLSAQTLADQVASQLLKK